MTQRRYGTEDASSKLVVELEQPKNNMLNTAKDVGQQGIQHLHSAVCTQFSHGKKIHREKN